MKRTIPLYLRIVLIITMLATLIGKGISQSADLPDELKNGTLNEQMNYIQERTRIYENYRAIREDMFQKIKNNSIDSLSKSKMDIISLKLTTSAMNLKIDSLTVALKTTYDKLIQTTDSKNSISVLGMEVNKTIYNGIMWIIIAALLSILIMGFLAFKRNLVITNHTKKELEELKEEFEAYRQTTREAREKMSMAHFQEIKKLKGK